VAGEDRSQQATPKRRQDARKEGQVVRSRELTSALALLSVVLLAGWQAGARIGPWRSLLGQMLGSARKGNEQMMGSISPILGTLFLQWLAAPFALLWSVAVLSSIAQGGLVLSVNGLEPKWDRLNPATNLGNLFSMAGVSRMLKSLLPVAVIVYVSILMASRDWMMVEASSRASGSMLLGWVFNRWYEISWKCGLVLLAWSGADYFFQRRNLENSLKMTREEVMRESRDTEGNPLVRGHIRRLRREIRQRWTMKDVQRATAVVTNPTHYAVALEYRPETMAAPVVIAKGMDRVAQRIKQAARWHNIPIVENPPLAQALFRATEVGEAIPAKLYAAVAEILAFLYRTQANLRNAAQASRGPGGSAPGKRN
jgi:flagellar biosynthesis protein FlhB